MHAVRVVRSLSHLGLVATENVVTLLKYRLYPSSSAQAFFHHNSFTLIATHTLSLMHPFPPPGFKEFILLLGLVPNCGRFAMVNE